MRILSLILGIFISLAACAEGGSPTSSSTELPPTQTFQAGKHYMVIDTPVQTITPGKIEVTEVFWYGCGHCFHFEPQLNTWKKTAAKDVELVKSPAIWRKSMATHARIFYAAQQLGVLDKAHNQIFKAMHDKTKPKQLVELNEITALFTDLGVEKEKFEKVFNSFAVTSLVQRADSRARSFGVSGTPEMVVDGRYRVSSRTAGGQAGMLKVVNFLIEKVRAEKS